MNWLRIRHTIQGLTGNRLVWWLPVFVHECIFDKTGWKLVQITNKATGRISGFDWVNYWPCGHPFDNKFPVKRVAKVVRRRKQDD